MDDKSSNSSNAGTWIGMGLAIGIGLAIVFMLHNISITLQMKNQQPATPMETGVRYIYDDQNRLQSMMPVQLKPV